MVLNSYGDFIFQDNETPERMQEVLEMSGKIDLMSYDEKEKLKENLVKLLPRCRTMDEIERFTKKRHGKWETIERYRLRCREIEKMVDHYYIKTRSDFLYQKKFFVNVEESQYVDNKQRVDMYKAQCIYLSEWQINWKAFMNQVISIRKVEKCPIVRKNESPISIEYIYKNEIEKCGISRKHKVDGLNDGLSIKDDWRKVCSKIVSKIVNHDLKEENEDDFDYLVVKAFEELEDCMDEIREHYLEKCIPKVRSREEIRNEEINKWNEDIQNSQKGSYKKISMEDLGCYYDALENEYRKGRRRRKGEDLVEINNNMSEDDRVELAKKTENEVFSTYTEFKPLEK